MHEQIKSVVLLSQYHQILQKVRQEKRLEIFEDSCILHLVHWLK
jgi:hypothetical protein